MGKYERIEEAPCQQFSFQASIMFKNLSPESKDRVWRRFHAWVKEARKKERWHSMEKPDCQGLNDNEEEVLEAMTEGARNGFCSLWERAEQNARNRNKGDGGLTMVDDGRPKERKEKIDIKRPTEYKPRRIVSAANYKQRDYNEEELEERLGVNDLFKSGEAGGGN